MPRGKRQLPMWVDGTHRQFKQQKRAELRDLKKALRKVAHGCALAPLRHATIPLPGYSGVSKSVYLGDVVVVVNQWIKACSVNEWGR